MVKDKATVVVVGGGATGVGILRDLSMRGIDALLIEKLDMVNGASSRIIVFAQWCKIRCKRSGSSKRVY